MQHGHGILPVSLRTLCPLPFIPFYGKVLKQKAQHR